MSIELEKTNTYQNMFNNCNFFGDISGWNVAEGTNIGAMFANIPIVSPLVTDVVFTDAMKANVKEVVELLELRKELGQ